LIIYLLLCDEQIVYCWLTGCCAALQVAEGVATAGVVVSLARKYRVSLPVLTAVAQVLDNNLEPAEAVAAVMNLPQIEER
jgi:glycerol-3-phosphate dehydrogenase